MDCTPANQVTEDFHWPLPRLQDLRYRASGARWFTRLDLRSAFFRIKVPKAFRHLTTFAVRGQQFQFRRMPFGLKTAPSTFQRFMDHHLADFMQWGFWYIDDILITADTKAQLRQRTRLVKQRLQSMQCEVNEDKSEYERTSLLFAGLWLFREGVGPNHIKVAEMCALAPPLTKKDAQSALGLVSYLRDFIPLAGHFTAMLYPEKEGFKLPPDQYLESWGRLMRHVAKATSPLRHWKDDTDADLYADASGHSVGVVIIQSQAIVGVASRVLTSPETRYSATDREALGLVYAAAKFKMFLHQPKGRMTVWTDHTALITRKSTELTPKQARWKELVDQWIPNLCHVPGKRNPADFFSRWGVEINGGALRL